MHKNDLVDSENIVVVVKDGGFIPRFVLVEDDRVAFKVALSEQINPELVPRHESLVGRDVNRLISEDEWWRKRDAETGKGRGRVPALQTGQEEGQGRVTRYALQARREREIRISRDKDKVWEAHNMTRGILLNSNSHGPLNRPRYDNGPSLNFGLLGSNNLRVQNKNRRSSKGFSYGLRAVSDPHHYERFGSRYRDALRDKDLKSIAENREKPPAHANLLCRKEKKRDQNASKSQVQKRSLSRRRKVENGRERKPTQTYRFGHEQQAAPQNENLTKGLKWSRAQKQKWVMKKGKSSEMEKRTFIENTGQFQVSCCNFDSPSSSSFLVDTEDPKGKNSGDRRCGRDEGLLGSPNGGRMVACPSMSEVVGEVQIRSSKEKDMLTLCIGKGIRMNLRTETANALLEELRSYREKDKVRKDKNEISTTATAADRNESSPAASTDCTARIRGNNDLECSEFCRSSEGIRRDLSNSSNGEEDETDSALGSLVLLPPVLECNEVPGVDIPLVTVRGPRSAVVMGGLMGLTFPREDGLDMETLLSLENGWNQNICKKGSYQKGERELRNLISYVNYDGRNGGRRVRSNGGRRREGEGKELVCL